jgi:hypothetical protein
MTISAQLKIDRASKHIIELNELFSKERPFTYILETNTETGERATFAKKNETVIEAAAVICGDAIHNLRSALDHAYWDIVSPLVQEWELRNVQFPFSETAARLDVSIKNRLAERVSPTFFKALVDLKPHGELGGNELLYLIHQSDIFDRHKLFIPTGDYTRISSDMIVAQVPDFPFRGTMGFGQNRRDVVWNVMPLTPAQRIMAGLGASPILEKELNVPVDIVFAVGAGPHSRPMIPTLHQLVDITSTTISVLRNASAQMP